MKNVVKIIAVLICIFVFSSCAKSVLLIEAETMIIPTMVPTPEFTAQHTTELIFAPTHEQTAELEVGSESDEIYWWDVPDDPEYRVESANELKQLLYEYGWFTMENATDVGGTYEKNLYAAAKSVFSEMLPILQELYPLTAKNGDAEVYWWTSQNDHDINDEAYLATVMYNMITKLGWTHPSEKRDGVYTVLSDAAVRDLMKVCFADFTDDTPLPNIKKSSEYSKNKWHGEIIHTEDGFRYYKSADHIDEYEKNYKSIIIDIGYTSKASSLYDVYMKETYPDMEVFFLFVVDIGGYERYTQMSGRQIWLVKNDEPDALGYNWRVAKIVVMPSCGNNAGGK